jgi:SAM-dependent methyltransferase
MSRANFDLVAHVYRWLEYLSFGPFLDRCRRTHIAQVQGARRTLVLGDGDGRFLARLLAANPLLTADVVDSSQAMLKLLDRRLIRLGPDARRRVWLHHADALEWEGQTSYDLIVSHFFLDCFFPRELELLLDRLHARTAPEARWVISEFAIPSGGLRAAFARGVVSLLYRSFGLLTGLQVRKLPDHAALMAARGWRLTSQRTYLAGLLRAEVWMAVRSSGEAQEKNAI